MEENNKKLLFGKWLVLEEVYVEKYKKNYYKCECQCPFKTVSIINKSHLRRGKTTKCKHCSSNVFIEHEDYFIGVTKKGEYFYFDKDDYDIVFSSTWSINSKGYVTAGKNGVFLRLHREIMKKHHKNLKFEDYIDHIDRCKANNTKKNLRITSSSVNQQNRGVQKNNKSTKVKGVHFNKATNKYTAYITHQKKRYHLGTFKTLEDAIASRERAEKIYHYETHSQNDEEKTKH